MDRTLAGYGAFLGSGKWQLSFGNWKYHLIYGRMFDHLWFLWFLCWLMAGFAVTVWLKSVFTRGRVVSKSRASSWSFFWLIPATMIPQFFMGATFPQFGPDTSAGVIPQPHILLYYGLFFAFGACCFEASETEGKIGRRWWALLPLGLLVVFPIGHLTLGQRLLAIVIHPGQGDGYSRSSRIGAIACWNCLIPDSTGPPSPCLGMSKNFPRTSSFISVSPITAE